MKSITSMRKLHQMFAKLLNIGNMTSPGRTNLPDFFTSLVPISAKVFRMVLMSAFFNSVELANSPVRPPLVMTFAVLTFLAFITFVFIAFIAPAISKGSRGRSVGNKQFEPKSTFKLERLSLRLQIRCYMPKGND